MDWLAPVDIYCERVGAEFWAEPWNAWSNLAFIVAAIWGGVTAAQLGVRHWVAWLLIMLAGLIGVGSFLFHTFANRWSELADVVPIWSFVAIFVLAGMRYIGGMAPARVARVSAIIVAAASLTVVLLATGEGSAEAASPDPLNGSAQYAPALLALATFTLLTWRWSHPAAPWLLAATGVFVLSLILRTVDRDLCEALPLGTHFLWHVLNGVMIGLLLQMLLRTGGLARLR